MTKDKRELVLKHLPERSELTDQELTGQCAPTVERIARLTGMSPQNVRNNLAKLEKSDRAHVVAHTPYRAPIWVKGAGVSIPKPAPRSREEALRIKRETTRARRAESPRQSDPIFRNSRR